MSNAGGRNLVKNVKALTPLQPGTKEYKDAYENVVKRMGFDEKVKKD